MKFFYAFLLSHLLLSANPEQEVLSEKPKIVLIHHFLSEEECDYLIELARPSLEPSRVVDETQGGPGQFDNRRSSHGMFLTFHTQDPIVLSIEDRLSLLTAIPKENGEALHILFYEEGGEYQPHYDFFNPDTPGGAQHLRRGGQRIATVIMYLNTPLAGGETVFPLANISVTPIKGSAVLFYNCLPSLETDPDTLHGGAPVIAGEKWIATRWFRARSFR